MKAFHLRLLPTASLQPPALRLSPPPTLCVSLRHVFSILLLLLLLISGQYYSAQCRDPLTFTLREAVNLRELQFWSHDRLTEVNGRLCALVSEDSLLRAPDNFFLERKLTTKTRTCFKFFFPRAAAGSQRGSSQNLIQWEYQWGHGGAVVSGLSLWSSHVLLPV